VLLLPLGALALALMASPERVAIAYARGDLDEVARLGAELGAARLAPMLDGPGARAAFVAAPATDDAWELLADLAASAGSWDRDVAAPAARAAVAIARRLGPDAAVRGELPDDALAARQVAWLALARRADRWADVRVHALEIAAHLADARRGTGTSAGLDVAPFLADDDPEVRRAACELAPVPVPPRLVPALAEVVSDDVDDAVALAAAQALCGDLAGHADRRPILAALGDPGLDRLRSILTASPPADAPAPALIDAARCLRADGSRDSQAALHAFAARAPAAVRPFLDRLLRPRGPGPVPE
jgi:hypothetical protein